MRDNNISKKRILYMRWYTYIFCFICISILFIAVKYKGIPNDLFKQKIEKELSINECEVNGYEINNNNYLIVVDDPNLTIYDNSIRSIIFDVASVQDEGIGIQIFYAANEEGFQETYSKVWVLKEGKNVVTIPYNHAIDKIRIDIGNFAGQEVCFNKIQTVNKCAETLNDVVMILLITLILCIVINWMLYLKDNFHSIEPLFDCLSIFATPFIDMKNQIIEFCKKNKKVVYVLAIIAICTYGALIFNYTLSIDEENNMANTNEYLVYFSSGRFFLGILIKIFGNSPYFNSFAAGILMFFAAIFLLVIFDRKNKSSFMANVLCGGLFMSMPYVIGETLNFAMQGLFIALGYILIFVSVWLFLDFELNKRKVINIIYGIIAMVMAFGIYQSFVVVFVFVIASITLLKIKDICAKNDEKKVFLFVGKSILYFVGGFVVYYFIRTLINRFIIPSNGYIDSVFIGWNKHMPNEWVFSNVWSNWYKVITGEYFNMTGGSIVKVTVLLYLIWIFANIVLANKHNRLWLFIVSVALLVLPFAIPLVFGTFVMLGRMLNAFPILLGFVWYVVLEDIYKFKPLYSLGTIIGVIVLIFQLKAYNEFVYADQLRYELDMNLANNIMYEVEKIEGYENKPIVFNGVYDFKNQNSMELVSGCESYFAFQNGDNIRIANFLNLSGYTVLYPTQEQIVNASNIAIELPVWPKEGSVYDAGDYIIVNFSNTQ